MRVRIAAGADDDEAVAIATALAEHLDESVSVYVGDETEPTAVHDLEEDAVAPTDGGPTARNDERDRPDADRSDADLGPTEREERLWDEIDDILEGGPEKYKEQLPEQGKLFVRDRLELWFSGDDSELRFEDGTFAAFDDWHPSGAGPTEWKTPIAGIALTVTTMTETATTAIDYRRTGSSRPRRRSRGGTSTSWPTITPSNGAAWLPRVSRSSFGCNSARSRRAIRCAT